MNEGFRQEIRRDGRRNLDHRQYNIELNSIDHAFGSSKVTFGEEQTEIICSIKADVSAPLPSE